MLHQNSDCWIVEVLGQRHLSIPGMSTGSFAKAVDPGITLQMSRACRCHHVRVGTSAGSRYGQQHQE